MPYIGNEVGNRFVASKAASVYSGNGSTTAFTLEHAVGSDEDILVSVDGVIQEPSVAYAVSSGTTLTFTAAPSSNSGNNIFVYYLFRTVATVDHPATSALSATSGTFSSTLNVTGETTLATHLNLGDNDKIKLGAGSDIEIYHDGTYSRIMESGGTALVLDTTSTDIRLTASNSEVMGKFVKDGAVELYHNNSKKFETDSSGVTVTGNVISNDGSNNARFQFDNNNQILIQNDTAMNFYVNGNNNLKIDSAGHVTMPSQSAFLADCNYTGSNLAINASHTVPALNERFDQNSDYNNSTYTFTAPVTGKYQLNCNFYVHFFDDSTNYVEFIINTSNRIYRGIIDNSLTPGDVDNYNNCVSVLADMDASDTAHMQINIPNSGTAQMRHSNLMTFSGYLVA